MTRYFHEKAASCQVHFLVVRHDSFPPTSGRLTVLASPRTTAIAESPYFLRTRCGVLTPVPAGCSQFGTGAAVSDPNWISLFSSDLVPSASRSHPNSAIGSNPVRRLSSFAPAVNYDYAMARTLRRLPRAGEVESPAFVPRLQQPSFSRVCHHFRSGAGPAFQIGIRSSTADDVMGSLDQHRPQIGVAFLRDS
jgi:hypothetical protein